MEYIILSPKQSLDNRPCFWRDNNSGYTFYPFAAGIYSQEEVESDPGYYNNGHTAIAIPLSDAALQKIGFKCSVDWNAASFFVNASKN
ncbi:hypothetical protein QEG73_21790 [Chitinophagaceae bacterium 26-R-25]|nr:hypothetical protein [Chitinophagaceae bacterium 26-R-25]